MNSFEFPKAFFVTGTDTDIGKTFVSTILTAGLEASYWKPIQTGIISDSDTRTIKEALPNCEIELLDEIVRLKEPLSPHHAADLENTTIDVSNWQLPVYSKKHLIVEGAGGLLVPINKTIYMIDLIKKFKIPVLLVARSGLGTLNHTLLSIEALRNRGIELLGVVMSGPFMPHNKKSIEEYGNTSVIAQIPTLDTKSIDYKEIFKKYF